MDGKIAPKKPVQKFGATSQGNGDNMVVVNYTREGHKNSLTITPQPKTIPMDEL